jgi:hypothetical protein
MIMISINHKPSLGARLKEDALVKQQPVTGR